jgi:hypothetical protein
MAVMFAYVPSTCDGRTVRDPEPQPVRIDPDPSVDPWSWLDLLHDELPAERADEVVAAG